MYVCSACTHTCAWGISVYGLRVVAYLCCVARMQVVSLDPATHAYAFWEGVTFEGKASTGRLFAVSKTLKVSCVDCVRRSGQCAFANTCLVLLVVCLLSCHRVHASPCPPYWCPSSYNIYHVVVQAIAIVQRTIRAQDPMVVMEELGFGSLKLVMSFPVHMSGKFSRL